MTTNQIEGASYREVSPKPAIDYLRIFGERLQALQPFNNMQIWQWETEHRSDRQKFSPRKFTACVVARIGQPPAWEVLLGKSTTSDYEENAHEAIVNEFHISIYDWQTHSCHLMVDSNGHVHLFTRTSEIERDPEVHLLLARYGIRYIWHVTGMDPTTMKNGINLFDSLTQPDSLVQIANTYGLSDVEAQLFVADPVSFWRSHRHLKPEQTSE